MSPSFNWEYRLLHLTTSHEIKNVEDALNDMGRQGWELITAYPHFDANIFVFKKRKG
jgi:isocitrate lyase